MELEWEDGCFVCGKGNAHGLQLEFRVDRDARSIETTWVPSQHHEGYRHIVHGGLVSTVLDEAMAKLSTCLDIPAVTAELTVRFLKPVPPNQPLRVVGRIIEQRRRVLLAEAEALLVDGSSAATAQAKLIPGKNQPATDSTTKG